MNTHLIAQQAKKFGDADIFDDDGTLLVIKYKA